jgi:hypothetical protein
VDLDNGVEVVIGHLPQHLVAQHSGVGHHHVQPAELRNLPDRPGIGG